MDYNPPRQTHSRWASEAEIKSSLYKVGLDDDSPLYGGIPTFAGSDSVCAGLSGYTLAENRPRRARRETHKERG